MATDQDAIKVAPEEIYGATKTSVVHVDGLEEDKPSHPAHAHKEEEAAPQSSEGKHSAPVTHETETVKSTYDTEDDNTKPSMTDKLRDKLTQVGDKLRPAGVVEGKNADPHPGMS